MSFCVPETTKPHHGRGRVWQGEEEERPGREEADGKGGKSRTRGEQRGETAGVEGEVGGPERQVQECPEDMADLLSVWQDDEHAQVVP